MRLVVFLFFYLYGFVVFAVVGICGIGAVYTPGAHVFVAPDVYLGKSPL